METAAVNNKLISVIFLCVFCFAWSTQDKLHVQIPLSELLKIRAQAEICGQQTGVPATHLKKIIDKTLPDDTPNKQFFQCVAFNSGYADKDGHLISDSMLKWNVVDGTKDDVLKIVEKCNKISKDVNFETLFATADCFHGAYAVSAQS